MYPAGNVEPETRLDALGYSVGEKRQIENFEASSVKKQRCGTPRAMKRVAEIVLVLSAMAKMRGGGRGPTDVELELMEEARERLVEICGELAPGDIVGKDAIASVIEDLGLNAKAKEHRLGFRMPRSSILERFSISKKKMEESKKFQASTPTYTSQSLQASITGSSHVRRSFPSDRPNHAPISFSSSPAPVIAASSSPVPHYLSMNEVRASTMTSGLPSSHLGRDSSSFGFPGVERSQVKLEGSSVSSYVSQGPVNSSANHPLVNAPTWSIQSQPGALTKPGQENKVLNYNPAKTEGRPFITQSSSGTLPMHAVNHLQAPPFINNHNEIAKIVQKLLQPKLPEHPTWNPPSREYMNKALTCQTCKFTINEVDTVLICDACEKGFHLKCLQPNTQKGIPRGEWHCTRCLSLSNGKPLAPKYGRVMRSINTPKAPSNTAIRQSNIAEAQSSSENKERNPDAKVNQPKIAENGSSGLRTPALPGTLGSTSVQSAFDSKIPNGRNLSSIGKQTDQGASTGTCSDSGSPVLSSSEKSSEHPQRAESASNEERGDPESKPQPSKTIKEGSDHPQPSHGMRDVKMRKRNSADVPLNKRHEVNSTVEDVKKSHMREDGGCSAQIKQNEQDAMPAPRPQISGLSSEVINHAEFSSDGLHAIEWIGDVIQVLDGKRFYESCCIDGVTYKVQDHALFHFSNDKLIPSKLQAMWEEIKTGLKFVDVRRCYFPGDLPETVGRPYTPESSEVYESNKDITVMAGMIQGPCEVLPPSKFKEESEKQSQLEVEANKGSRPVFLCKWLYGESKGSFQPVLG